MPHYHGRWGRESEEGTSELVWGICMNVMEELECQITFPLKSMGSYGDGRGRYTDAVIYLINIH
jgi:hypothetical protein